MEDVGRVKKVRRFFKKYLSPSVKRNRFFTEGRNACKNWTDRDFNCMLSDRGPLF